MKINEREDSRQHIWKPPTAVFSADNYVRREGSSARSQPTRDQDSLRPYQSRHLRVIILSPLDTMEGTELRPMGALGMAWHLLLLTWYGALSAGTYMAWSAGVISDVWRKKLVGRDKPTTGQIPEAFDRESRPVSLFLKLPVWHRVRPIM